MFIAINKKNERIAPVKGVNAFCPSCKRAVVARIGKIVSRHWAHKEKCDCEHGRGMTKWHYRWVERHYKKSGWTVEWPSDAFRFDCFNKSENLVVEVQTKPIYEYVINKTDYALSKGYKIKWVFHEKVMESFEKLFNVFQAKSLRRLVILDLIQMYSNSDSVEFYIDSHAVGSEGNSSQGLLRLQPTIKEIARYPDYYRVPYVRHEKK